MIFFSNIIVIGTYDENDYAPAYYEFSDNIHTIVIEEESFMLYGGGTVYQILDDNKAVEIVRFTTDDGGRNNGKYVIEWFDDCAEITYNTFVDKSSKNTIRAFFN